MKYQRIFVAIDDSASRNSALDKALELAAQYNASLCIGHVVNTGPIEAMGSFPPDLLPSLKEEYDNRVAELIEQARATEGIKEVIYQSEVGPIRETLLEKLIAPFEPDLVVCGARGLSALKYALLGSVSSFLVKHVNCDVLVIRS